jgi:hypothetical protein
MKLVEKKDFYGAENLYWKENGAFAQEQRNAVFVSAAESLVMANGTPTNKAGTYLNAFDGGALSFMNSMVAYYDYVTLSNGTTYNDCGITTAKAIPYLIEGLKVVGTGDPRFIDQYSQIIIQILGKLTRRNTGYVNGYGHFFERNHEAVIKWWQEWWQENKERHPVFDANLEIILRDAVLKIEEEVTQAKPNRTFQWDGGARFALEQHGDFYSGNEWNGGSPNSAFTFSFGHSQEGGAKNGTYAPELGDDVLYIRGEFLTKGLAGKDGPAHGTSFSGQKFPMQEIFSETVNGTGIAIKVQIATTNTALLRVLGEKLKK